MYYATTFDILVDMDNFIYIYYIKCYYSKAIKLQVFFFYCVYLSQPRIRLQQLTIRVKKQFQVQR